MNKIKYGYASLHGQAASVFVLFAAFQLLSSVVYAQTELGAADDLTVLGTDGTALDPDVEIKGFTVFGSTQADYTGATAGPGNVVVNGVLAVSSGAYFVGNSTFPVAGKIFVNDGAPGQLLRKHTAGHLEWSDPGALGDNLGNHTATQVLNMGNKAVDSVSSMTITGTGVTGSNPLFKVAGSTMVVLNNGNVGVGTASPASLLHVYGANPAVTVRGSGSNSAEINLQGNDGDWHLENQYVNGAETNLFRIYNSALSANAVTILRNSNNVGIGTAAPGSRLEVTGGSVTFHGSDSNSAIAGFTDAGGNYRMVVSTNGNIGIGTTSPGEKLDIAGAIKVSGATSASKISSTGAYPLSLYKFGSGAPTLSMSHANGTEDSPTQTLTGDVVGGINMFGYGTTGYSGGPHVRIRGIAMADNLGTDQRNTDLVFEVAGGVSLSEGMRIASGGNVGIGTTTPVGLLHVGAGVTPGLLVTSAGNVGIGTISPTSGLHVKSATADGASAIAMVLNTQTEYLTSGAKLLSVQNNGVEQASIDKDGGAAFKALLMLGAGNNFVYTSTPGAVITMANSEKSLSIFAGGGAHGGQIDFYGGGTSTNLEKGGTLIFRAGREWPGSAFSMPERMRIDYTGNIGIGTEAPGANLHISSTSASAAQDMLRITTGTANADVFVVKGSGNVGISTGAPQARLDVLAGGATPDVMAQIWRKSDGVIVGSMSATGVMMATKFVGDASGLTGIAGDNLGNHTATQVLNMGNKAVDGVSSMTITGTGVTGSNPLFKVAGSAMVVLNNGNVGIGTTGPGSKLEIAGSVNALKLPETSIIRIGDTWNVGSLTLHNGGSTMGSMAASGLTWVNGFDGDGGTVNLPTYGFSEEANLGIYRPAAGSLGFVRGGAVEAMRIDSAGNVGIGTTGPATTLDVRAATPAITVGKTDDTDGALYFGNSSHGVKRNYRGVNDVGLYTTSADIYLSANGTASNQFVLNNSGNVGIGTDVPEQRLTVAGNISQAGVLISSGTGNNYFAGNVGIGTASPDSKLHILGTSHTYLKVSAQGSGSSTAQAGLKLVDHYGGEWSIATDGTNNGDLYFKDGSAEMLRILNNGNVGIGTTSPGAKLEVAGGSVTFRGSDTNAAIAGFTDAGGNYRMVVSTNGNVGIGTTSPAQKLQVAGTANIGPGAFNNGGLGYGSALSLSGTLDMQGNRLNLNIGGSTGYFLDSSSLSIGWGGSGVITTVDGALTINPAGTANLILKPTAGNVGIGTASPGARLEVAGGSVTFRGSDANAAIAGFTDAGGNYRMVVSTNGNVGIGTTNPGYRLHVSGGAGEAGTVMAVSTGTSNLFWVAGDGAHAVKFFGDGSGLTGISGGSSASIDVSTINATATTPYGGVNITTNVFITGGARIARYAVQAADAGVTLASADFGKTITVNSGSAQTVTLPSVTAADIGATITVVKLGAGKVTIQAAASTYIADSTSGGTIYNNAVSPAYATITLRLVTATQWMIVGGDSAWVTT